METVPQTGVEAERVRRRYSIGRQYMEDVEGAWYSIASLLEQEGAEVFTKKIGFLYLKQEVVRRHIGKTTDCRPKIEEAINHTTSLSPSNELVISRDRLELIRSNSFSNARVDTYSVAAPVIRATGLDGERFDFSLEKQRLRKLLDVDGDRQPPEAWLGYINLPLGSGAAVDIAYALDEAVEDRIPVGPLQIM